MAQLWLADHLPDPAVIPLEGDRFVVPPGRGATLTALPPDEPVAERLSTFASPAAALVRSDASDPGRWTLIGLPAAVRVNGLPLAGGLHVLRHQDELCMSCGRFFFSSEELARVEEFPGLTDGRAAACPRCKQEIVAGTAAIRCPSPSCGIWHHQSEKLPCWTYAPQCALCSQPTELDAAYRWIPQGI